MLDQLKISETRFSYSDAIRRPTWHCVWRMSLVTAPQTLSRTLKRKMQEMPFWIFWGAALCQRGTKRTPKILFFGLKKGICWICRLRGSVEGSGLASFWERRKRTHAHAFALYDVFVICDAHVYVCYLSLSVAGQCFMCIMSCVSCMSCMYVLNICFENRAGMCACVSLIMCVRLSIHCLFHNVLSTGVFFMCTHVQMNT